MPSSPYFDRIQKYFPADQWDNADCISTHECSPDRSGYPQTCIGPEGMIDCGHGAVNANSRGPFQILDACWSPYLNPNSPFTKDEWDQVLDPDMNTWMASVIWSRGGWGAWSTCAGCSVCGIGPGAIPYPDGPVPDQLPGPGPVPLPTPIVDNTPLAVGLGLLLLVVGVATARKGGLL